MLLVKYVEKHLEQKICYSFCNMPLLEKYLFSEYIFIFALRNAHFSLTFSLPQIFDRFQK
jgi:hypothetical protein